MGLKLPVYLCIHLQVDAQSHDGLTALGFAAATGHLDIVSMLSQNAAKVDSHTGYKDCQTPTLSCQYFCQTFFVLLFFYALVLKR